MNGWIVRGRVVASCLHRVMTRAVFAAILTSIGWAGVVAAQPPGQRGSAGEQVTQERQLERRLQERVYAIAKERLELSDGQVTQLQAVTSQLEQERQAVRTEEREIRMALRSELLAGSSASEQRVAELLDRLPRVERRRIDLMESEQRELARFLSPLQRARYFALQDEIRRNLQQMLQRRAGEAQPLRPPVRPQVRERVPPTRRPGGL